MNHAPLADLLDFTGTLFVLRFHWFWLALALWLGAWVGWRMAAEKAGPVETGGKQ